MGLWWERVMGIDFEGLDMRCGCELWYGRCQVAKMERMRNACLLDQCLFFVFHVIC
jgi:hypothetical protein